MWILFPSLLLCKHRGTEGIGCLFWGRNSVLVLTSFCCSLGSAPVIPRGDFLIWAENLSCQLQQSCFCFTGMAVRSKPGSYTVQKWPVAPRIPVTCVGLKIAAGVTFQHWFWGICADLHRLTSWLKVKLGMISSLRGSVLQLLPVYLWAVLWLMWTRGACRSPYCSCSAREG